MWVDSHGRRPGTYFEGWTLTSHFLDQHSLDGIRSQSKSLQYSVPRTPQMHLMGLCPKEGEGNVSGSELKVVKGNRREGWPSNWGIRSSRGGGKAEGQGDELRSGIKALLWSVEIEPVRISRWNLSCKTKKTRGSGWCYHYGKNCTILTFDWSVRVTDGPTDGQTPIAYSTLSIHAVDR